MLIIKTEIYDFIYSKTINKTSPVPQYGNKTIVTVIVLYLRTCWSLTLKNGAVTALLGKVHQLIVFFERVT